MTPVHCGAICALPVVSDEPIDRVADDVRRWIFDAHDFVSGLIADGIFLPMIAGVVLLAGIFAVGLSLSEDWTEE